VANILYPAAKQLFLEAQLNWTSDPIYGILLNTAYYTVSLAHASLADIDSQAFIVSSGIMTGRTTLNGVADGDDLLFPATTGPIVRACILVKDGGTAIQSKLIAYIDTAANLPYTPAGLPILLAWDNGPNRIFSL
jgi:hypothetical protein